MSDTISEFTDLGSVYGAAGKEAAQERYQLLNESFVRKFGAGPDVFARSPGRVNLIGEHIDYEGYAVLPMAIKQDTVFAIRKGGDCLHLANLDEKYEDNKFPTDPAQPVDVGKHTWGNYFLAAYKGVYAHLEARGMPVPEPVGLQVMCHGQVPTGSGLSSSSAFVCAASMAILGVHGIQLTKREVAEFTCTTERLVGTESGGMDQAISIMGRPGVAMMIEFNPVRGTDCPLGEGATFVIANSLAVSAKAETAPYRYNMRVVECRLATACLAIALGVAPADAVKMKTLVELEPLVQAQLDQQPAGDEAKLAVLKAAAKMAGEKLHEALYTQQEVEDIIGMKLATLFSGNDNSLRVLQAATNTGGFALQQRARHVYEEAARVLEFRGVCKTPREPAAAMAELGALMDASQTSCRDLYQCSCPELDELVAVCKANGALGSRLTGAGWGGCTVSLVTDAQVEDFIAAVEKQYYAKRVEAGVVKAEDLGKCVFGTKPSQGGAILRLPK